VKNRFLPLIISLALAGLLAFLVKDFVREVIIRPFLYVLWYLTLFLKSLPEFFFWGLFILIALIMAGKSLAKGSEPRKSTHEEKASQGGPVAVWARMAEHAERGGYSRWQQAQALARLTWHVLGDGERLSLYQIQERLYRDETLDLPPEIKAYFQACMLPYQPLPRFGRRKLEARFAPLNLDPGEVVKFLEDKLNPLAEDLSQATHTTEDETVIARERSDRSNLPGRRRRLLRWRSQ